MSAQSRQPDADRQEPGDDRGGDRSSQEPGTATGRAAATAARASRHRASPGSATGRARAGRHGTGSGPLDGQLDGLYAEMLRAARELLAVRSPLDAELMVSELLGTWWGQRPAAGRLLTLRRRRPPLEELIGEGLIGYAESRGNATALALLSGMACLGTQRQAALAEHAALELIDRGVARPGWAEHVGAVEAAECYVNSDPYGDTDEVVSVFSYAELERHALVITIDYNRGGVARDGWVTSQVDKLLERCDRAAQIAPAQARRMLAAALDATDRAADPPVSDSFSSYHAFMRARVRTLPPSDAAKDGRPRPWGTDRRAALIAKFLASDEAEELSDREAASGCADRIVDHGCDQDFGRPLRVSPAKSEAFLLDWLPRKVLLTPQEKEAMPHVLLAWVRFAGPRSGLSRQQVNETLEAICDAMPDFARIYRDPAEFGLAADLTARLLPDGDLEALARRVFAFPLLTGSYSGIDLATLNPARATDRRTLLEADHDSPDHPKAAEGHIDRHISLADRLWRGDPPELWEAAQRLLDLGVDRHEVLHELIAAIRSAAGDENELTAALADLPQRERG